MLARRIVGICTASADQPRGTTAREPEPRAQRIADADTRAYANACTNACTDVSADKLAHTASNLNAVQSGSGSYNGA
jgi:hypothetical protein